MQNLIEEREYEFRIFAENEAGLSEPVQTSAIKVHDPNAPVGPDFIKRLTDIDTSEGKTVNLEIQVNGNPKPYVQWFKGAREIRENAKFSFSSDGDKFTLTISNITSDEQDEYTVKIKNKSGFKTSKANVSVRCSPKIKLPSRLLETTTYDKAETVTIRIPYIGCPIPNFKWSVNGQDVSNDDRYAIEITESHAIITLKNTDSGHTGEYQIKLDNPLGSDSCKFKVQILGKLYFLYISSIKFFHLN